MKGCHTKERITLNPKQILEKHVTQTHDPNQGRDVEHGAGRGGVVSYSVPLDIYANLGLDLTLKINEK